MPPRRPSRPGRSAEASSAKGPRAPGGGKGPAAKGGHGRGPRGKTGGSGRSHGKPGGPRREFVEPPGPPATKAELERLLAKGGCQATAPVRDKLWAFHEILRDGDEILNLTRIRGFQAMVEKHYVDSLLPAQFYDLPSPLMDLGSGGGFPGIPLAIRYPEVEFVLVEGRRKRAAFLEHVARSLELTNVRVVARKLNPADEIPVEGVITRAFADARDTLERVARSVRPGGRVLLMKGPNCDDEIADVGRSGLPFELDEDIGYKLPFSNAHRRLLVYRRSNRELPPVDAPDLKAVPRREADRRVREAAPPPPPDRPEDLVGAGVTSPRNDRFRHWQTLLTGRGIRRNGETLVAGEKIISELLRDCPDAVLGLLGTPAMADPWPSAGAPWFRLAPSLMRELDVSNTGAPLAWVRTPPMPDWTADPAGGGLTLIVPLQNPENIGAVLRSAEAFAIREVVLCAEAASPFLPKALRAGGPAAFRLPLRLGPSLGESVRSPLPTFALDLTGTPLKEVKLPTRAALVVGLEGGGTAAIPADIPRVAIPMPGGTESLNAAVAVGIALYELAPGR